MCALMIKRTTESVPEIHAPVLQVRDLGVHFRSETGEHAAVAGVSFEVRDGETLALVGESGAGKSMTALAIMRLLRNGTQSENVRVDGKVLFRERTNSLLDVLSLDMKQMRDLRGRAMSMVFQEPTTSLNPVVQVGQQISEAILAHEAVTRRVAGERAVAMLRLVGIADPGKRQRAYPHELSGGMRQRVMIAMALACRPQLLIADEPTTALDVTVQAQVLDLVRDLQREFRMAVLFITHDLGVVAQIADRVAVMYAGRIVEEAPAEALFEEPRHPYTAGLLRSMPNAGRAVRAGTVKPIPGSMPSPARFPTGCAFHPRCTLAESRCVADLPSLEVPGERRSVRCWRWREQSDLASAA